MSELIKAAINIKDPFTLLAFFAVIVLIAFGTKTVPESLFKHTLPACARHLRQPGDKAEQKG